MGEITLDLIQWIRDWFDRNGKGCNAIVGISGGKDSTIVAALCVQALGKDRVIGILMPQGNQKDIVDSFAICEYLGIKYQVANIEHAVDSILNKIDNPSAQTIINLPPRIRMATLYAFSQSHNGRVVGTTNRSEAYVGYFTRYGDGGVDVEPIINLTVTEVLQIGDYLDLPKKLVHKIPDDGLPGSKTDEEKLGFSYKVLDDYLLKGIEPKPEILDKIKSMHKRNLFKFNIPESFMPCN